ncbi:hypothetical protein MNBD_GAMMA17-105 [hydrothermal vent metagenome]|uniref:DUF1439 domain-containing protein n=1 Tax=hydrothermal vent metagenome TaxID=652676 RepID=A0A3B0ZTT6_9ZZZZ
MKHYLFSCGFFITLLLFLVQSSVAFAYTIELSKDEVQTAVAEYFPVKHISPFVMLTAHDPKVSLDPKNDRIGLEFSVLANVPGILTGEGRGLIDGDLEYRHKTGEFYLRDPKIKSLELYDMAPEIVATVKLALQQLMKQSLPVILVYKLQGNDLKQNMARRVLSSVDVRDGKLLLELSVPVLSLID